MDTLQQDLRLALRALRRRPVATLLAALTLAIGLGVNTVAFSIVNALVFRPFHVPGGDRTGWVFAGSVTDPLRESSAAVFEALRTRAHSLEIVAAEGRAALALQRPGATSQAWALFVSDQYFSLIPPPLVAGRVLDARDVSNTEAGVLISERFWRSEFGGATDLTSLSLVLNRHTARVVGVVADGFQGPGGVFEPQLWAPLDAARAMAVPMSASDRPWLTVIARPAAGASAAAIAQELPAVIASVTAEPVSTLKAQFVPIIDGHPEARSLRPVAAVALGAVGIVLLIACFNVAAILLAQSVDRRRDFGVRTALGASRGRLVRQLITEGLVLGLIAGAAALLLAHWSEALLGSLALPAPIPQRLHFAIDGRLIAYAVAASLLAALIPTVAPAWLVWRTDLTRWVRGNASSSVGAGHARTRRLFLIAEVAGSTAFLIFGAIFIRAFLTTAAADPGFDAPHLAVMTVAPAEFGYTPERTATALRALTEDMRRIPGVMAVATADQAPFFVGLSASMTINTEHLDCRTTTCPSIPAYAVDAHFVDAMGMRLRAGRALDPTRADDRDAVVISAATATRFWPSASAIGQRFDDSARRTWTVVGVVDDIAWRQLRADPPPVAYRLLGDADFTAPVAILARTAGEPSTALGAMRASLQRLDPHLPASSVQTMAQRMAMPLWPSRTLAAFFGVCSVVSLLLATAGLFGVTYQVVSQRTREFGIRLAIGGSAGALQRLVLGESLRLVAPGLVMGALIGAAGTALVRAQWLGVERPSVAVVAAVMAAEVVVALLAAWWPARRASRVDPLIALRDE